MTMTMTQKLRQAFHQFARNERFGTCVDCPVVDVIGPMPEVCKNTERYDHQLDLDDLLRAYRMEKTRG